MRPAAAKRAQAESERLPEPRDLGYKLERIVRPRTLKKEAAFEVKWAGLASKENTLELRSRLVEDGYHDAIEAFEAKHAVKWAEGGKYTWRK